MIKRNILKKLAYVIMIIFLFGINFIPSKYVKAYSTGREILVSNANDSGSGSLRSAILDARAGDFIHFDPTVFPKENPQTILLETVLPELSQGAITVDGTGAGVILDGSKIIGEGGNSENSLFSGLIITSDNNIIRNISIINFPGNGIFIQKRHFNVIGGNSEECKTPCNVIRNNGFSGILIEDGGQNIVQGNYLGTDITGSKPEGNGLNGVRIMNSSENSIGGIEPGAGNVIGANSIGIEVNEKGSHGNKIIGNIIGVDINSQTALGNIHAGISAAWSSSENLFEGNIISGNEIGIVFEKESNGNVLTKNYIGTNSSLNSGIGNRYAGVVLASAYNNSIGPDNFIMWNGEHGVRIENTNNLVPYGNRITQNTISENEKGNIYLADSITEWQPEPHDLKVSGGAISGFTVGNQDVEIYTDNHQSGGAYLATVKANNRGYFSWIVPASIQLKTYVSAISFEENGTTSVFSKSAEEDKGIITTLPGVVGPTQVSTEPKVLYWNFIFALVLLAYCKVMTNLFNKTLKKYGDLIIEKIVDPFQNFIRKPNEINSTNLRVLQNRWINWLIFLVLVVFIQSWLNPASIPFFKRISLTLSIFVCAAVVGFIKEISERLIRRIIKHPFNAEATKVHWLGILIASISTAFSRLIQFSPGIVLGSIEVFNYKPSIQEKRTSALRILTVRGAIFVITLSGWLVSSLTKSVSPGLTSILQLIFTVALQGLFFELLPLANSMDGSALIRWNFWSWIGLFLPVSFFTFWLVLNPNGSGIKAIQQNSISTLIIVLIFLAIMVFMSDLIFKRLEKKITVT